MTRTSARWLSLLAAAIIVAIGGVGAFLVARHKGPSNNVVSDSTIAAGDMAEVDSRPLPPTPTSASPYRNTRPNVQYVGSDACVECHTQEHESFRHTGMGRSMARVDAAVQPPDAVFSHSLSGRRYEVRRRDGQLWHRELLLADPPDEQEVVLQEHPLKFAIGSGRYALTYAAEADGFLVESPLTWYASRNAWDMSPGYDAPGQEGFQRAIPEGCLDCHAGRTESIDGSLHRLNVIEEAISCERCHGPGELHVRKWSGSDRDEGFDDTIVNPAPLSRTLAESICQQCHLRASAPVLIRGKGVKDFRPGLPLADFRQEYQLEASDRGMTVVGHVEQMHNSKCYQASTELTCITCHDPHGMPSKEEAESYYRAACLRCHAQEACTAPAEVKRRESPSDNCVQCHMPSSPTQVVHVALTHHRIGIHDGSDGEPSNGDERSAGAARRPVLKPFLDDSRLSAYDRQRSLGVGYMEAAMRASDSYLADQCRRQGLASLTAAQAEGMTDPAMESALALLRFHLNRDGVLSAAQRALASPDLAPHERCTALLLSADVLHSRGEHQAAIGALLEATKMRRRAADWLLLADCQASLGQPEYIESLEQAVRINTRLSKVHAALEKHYRARGDASRAEWHAAHAAMT